MSTRSTSIETYHTIKENGLLSERRMQVYKTVFEHGPMTSAEAFRILNEGSPIRNITQSRARFTELRDLGVFSEVGTKTCSITGHRAILWDVTKKLPAKPMKTKKVKCSACKGLGYHLHTIRSKQKVEEQLAWEML